MSQIVWCAVGGVEFEERGVVPEPGAAIVCCGRGMDDEGGGSGWVWD